MKIILMVMMQALGKIFQDFEVSYLPDGFGGLLVSMLASGTRVRGFNPGRIRWIFPVW
jgi:hypothetical protein